MTKKEISIIVEGGKATAGPPLGPALGPLGINAGQVVAEINKITKEFEGMKVPVKVIVDTKTKKFEIKVESPYVSELLKKEAGIEKGHGKAWREGAVADVKMESIVKIAKLTREKGQGNLKSRVKEVLGTALSMGVTVEGKNPKEVIKEVDRGKYDSLMVES